MIPLEADTDLAVLLSDLLRLSGHTQAWLALETDYAPGQVSKWLRGVVVPSYISLLTLLAALGYRPTLLPQEDTP